MPATMDYDVIIVGGGPAGLSAALILGRCMRSVLLCDDGQPRNYATRAVHGFLTRDGINPIDLRGLARQDLAQYKTVNTITETVIDVESIEGGFRIQADKAYTGRKLLLATGIKDTLPEVEGAQECYGKGLYHCPYCDGYEYAEKNVGIYVPGNRGFGMALELKGWSNFVTLFTDGPADFPPEKLERLRKHSIAIVHNKVKRFVSRDGSLCGIELDNGVHELDVVFFKSEKFVVSPLALKLGCAHDEKLLVRTGQYQSTHLPGLYVAGDAARTVNLVIVAAAEGAEAAFAINQDLLKEQLGAME